MDTIRSLYEDGTGTAYEYSEDNLSTAMVSRTGARTAWEYDDYGGLLCETEPDEYAKRYEYDERHDVIREWDTEQGGDLLSI